MAAGRSAWSPEVAAGAGQERTTVDILLRIGNWLVPLVYLALVMDYGAMFLLRAKARGRNVWVVPAVAFHAALLVLRGVRLGHLPLDGNMAILSIIALSSAIVYCVMEYASGDTRAGVFVFLLVFLFQYTSSTFLAHRIATPSAEAAGRYGWGRAHVIPAALAYTALGFAAVYGLLYLMGRRGLRQHRFGLLFDRLPALDLLGTLSWQSLVGGFALMTVSMVTGAVVFGQARNTVPLEVLGLKVACKIITGSVAWLICGAAILGKVFAKWSAERICLLAVGGFLVIVVLLVASISLS